MIARPLTRRAVVAGGLVATAALTGCSVSSLTKRKIEDPEAADRARLQKARDLSAHLRGIVDATLGGDTRPAGSLAEIRALHTRQIAEFVRSGGLSDPSQVHTNSLNPGPLPVDPKELSALERQLAQNLRGLAMQAQRGDIAALLASAAAGIDQALVR